MQDSCHYEKIPLHKDNLLIFIILQFNQKNFYFLSIVFYLLFNLKTVQFSDTFQAIILTS